MSGLLIVNADDWGGHAVNTDRIEQCFQAGAITSASAMVFFPDSERAARLARERGRPLGLHLNLTEELAGDRVPAAVRERHDVVREPFADHDSRRWRWDPRRGNAVALAIADQLHEFIRLYGDFPTHLDSHHHVHVSPDVFLSGGLPQGLPVRTTLSPHPGAPRSAWRVASSTKRAALAAGFKTAARFWSLPQLHAELEGEPGWLEKALAQARRRIVEVMVHPSEDEEHALLTAPEWRARIARERLGSYADMGGSRVPFFATLAEPLADYGPLLSTAPL